MLGEIGGTRAFWAPQGLAICFSGNWTIGIMAWDSEMAFLLVFLMAVTKGYLEHVASGIPFWPRRRRT